ncbi:MAG: LytTR family transcriptional regulator DNA-binding domain-containing protein [Ruminococcus sp.]|nr:LytTR family transcriptional regulator DNA-binding domain-containing protein [Ruminococcus sp.]
MKQINIRFEQDKTLDSIDVVIRAGEKDHDVESLIDQLSQNKPQKLTLLDKNDCPCVVDKNDVITVTSDGKQVRVITKKGIFTAKQTLQNVEESLSSRMFLRISRFEIVNLMKIRKYDFTIGGTLRIEFEGGMETWASRRYIPLIKKKLSGEEGYLC